MLESFPFPLLVGTVLGFLSGLGVGGGSLLILWLTLVLGWEPSRASGVNLLFFLPAAAAATVFRRKEGRISGKILFPAIISGCLSAFGFSLLRFRVDTELLRRAFGFMLLAVGLREISWKRR